MKRSFGALRIALIDVVAALALCGATLASAQTGAGASPQNYPKLKPGLWEVTTNLSRQDGQPPRVTSMCLDATVQQELYRMSTGAMANMCSQHDLKFAGNTLTSTSTCEFNGTKMQSKAVMVVTGDTSYHSEAHTTFDPPMRGMKEASTTIDGKHVGPCKPGQKPGDVILPGGQTMNFRQMQIPPGPKG